MSFRSILFDFLSLLANWFLIFLWHSFPKMCNFSFRYEYRLQKSDSAVAFELLGQRKVHIQPQIISESCRYCHTEGSALTTSCIYLLLIICNTHSRASTSALSLCRLDVFHFPA